MASAATDYLEEPSYGEVQSAKAALRGLRVAPRLITSIYHVLGPHAVELLKLRGFVTDDTPTAELPLATQGALYCEVAVRKQLVLQAAGAATPLKRTVQRVRLDYDTHGKQVGAHLWTYSWPSTGGPGVNIEAVSHWPRHGATRRLSWTMLDVEV